MGISFNTEYVKELKKIEELEKNVEEKKFSPFDIINYLTDSKSAPAWNELTEAEQKAFSPFLTYRSLSSNERLIRLLSAFSQYSSDPGELYEFLRNIMDNKQRWYYNYKAYKKAKIENEAEYKLTLYAVKKQYKLGNRDAEYYMDNLSPELLESLRNKWKEHYETIGNQ